MSRQICAVHTGAVAAAEQVIYGRVLIWGWDVTFELPCNTLGKETAGEDHSSCQLPRQFRNTSSPLSADCPTNFIILAAFDLLIRTAPHTSSLPACLPRISSSVDQPSTCFPQLQQSISICLMPTPQPLSGANSSRLRACSPSRSRANSSSRGAARPAQAAHSQRCCLRCKGAK